MITSVQYSSVNARLKAISGKMLKDDDFETMKNLDSVQEVFSYLYKNSYYHDNLELLEDGNIHRSKLEMVLKQSFINDYQIIQRYLTGKSRDFFQQLFTKFEVEDLKMLLRTILIEHDEDYFKESIVYLGTYTNINLDNFFEINSYDQLINRFKDTVYYPVLARFTDKYEKDNNLFSIEMSLDFQYFSWVEKLAQKLGQRDRKYVEELVGLQMDLLNIQWIYRIKKYYNKVLSAEEILNYIIPFHYKLGNEEINQMAKSNDAEGIEKHISYNKYKEIFNKARKDESIVFEKYFLSYIREKSFQVKRTSVYNIGNIIAYLFIKEYEIRDIITVVEGIRYALPPDEISKYLIRDGEQS